MQSNITKKTLIYRETWVGGASSSFFYPFKGGPFACLYISINLIVVVKVDLRYPNLTIFTFVCIKE